MRAAQRPKRAESRGEAGSAQEGRRDGPDGDGGQTLQWEGALRQEPLVEPDQYRRADANPERDPQRDVALHLAPAPGRSHFDRERVERGGADAERRAGEHPVRQHRRAGGGQQQRRRAGQQDEGEHEGHAPPERVQDPAAEGTHTELGNAGGAEHESDAAGIVALVVQEQGQHRDDAEMAGRPQEQTAHEGEHVPLERHRRRPVGHASVTRAFTISFTALLRVRPLPAAVE